MAYSLNRRDESLRYAVKLAEKDASDPDLPRRIGMYMAENGNLKTAIELLERSVDIMRTAKKPPADTLPIEAELARLDFLAQRYSESAALMDKISPALAKPKDAGLDSQARQAIIGQAGITYEIMGDVYLEVGRPTDAAKAFRALNDLAPKPAVLALNMARVDFKSKQSAEALVELQKYFDSHPADLNLGALDLLSRMLKDLKQSDQLTPRLKKLHSAMPGSIAVTFDLAEQMQRPVSSTMPGGCTMRS